MILSINKGKDFISRIKRHPILLAMSLPFVIHLIVFAYIPIWGWLMAFQEYKPGVDFFSQKWVGLKQFFILFNDDAFYRVLRNTLAISVIKLIMGTFFSIFLAIMLNETRNKYFKKTVQTISYLPHFISWVVAANIVSTVLSTEGGIVNDVLLFLNIIEKPIFFLGRPDLFWGILGWSHIWKEIGWGAIIYLAAMTSIDPQLYEAANVDGANRIQKIWHITLPGIKSIVVILLIMNIGHILEAGFEQVYLLKNGLVQDYSEIFTIYILKYGIQLSRYSLATAAGIFRSLVSIILLITANKIASNFNDESLF